MSRTRGNGGAGVFWIFAAGLAVSVIMALRSQYSTDQWVNQLSGWAWYAQGRLLFYGSGISGGGLYPGPLTSLLTGLPLFIVEDYRTVNFVILLTHVLAYLVLDRTLRPELEGHGRLLFAAFYWLNPWRMYFSAHLLNTNFLFLLGALHLWSVRRQRHRADWLGSCVLVLSVGLAFELHASFLILALATLLLFWRGYFRLHWWSAVLTAAVIGLSLVPFARLALEHPEVMPMHRGFLGRGLILVFPLLRGVLYWLRYPSMLIGRAALPLDFTRTLGAGADAWLSPLGMGLIYVTGVATMVLSLAANLWLWRGGLRSALARPGADTSERQWLLGVLRWNFVAALIAFGLSPTTIMSWQGLIVLHISIIIVVLWLQDLSTGPRAPRVRTLLRAQVVVALLVCLAVGLGAPMYRKGGRRALGLQLPGEHPMVERLGIDRHCTVRINPKSLVPMELLRDARETPTH